ncbi:MAG: hypothetical protein Q8M94_18495, partial [Ignavibacteria bacterium]|nr:hypothetical protein [Ignavibacteria bacterium]
KQTTSFTQGNEVHRKNASVEFPAKLFIEAVRLARAIDFGKDSAFAQSILGIQGGAEQHPAIKLLNEWWMKNSPVKSDYSVGYAIPFVRVRDDNEYWCAYHEVPNTPMEAFLTIANTQARIGDVVLLQFYASHIHYKGDNDGVHIILADGTPYMTIGIEAEELYSGQYDETLNSLEALFYFPSRFPLAWELLKTL